MESTTSQRGAVSVLHHYVGDDGDAMDGVLRAVEERTGLGVDGTGDAHVGLTAKTRLLGGDPPDVWDDWPGRNMRPYWNADVLADLTDLWEDAGFADAFHDHAAESAAIEGRYYALPTNVQRLNNLYYDVELIEAAGVDPEGIRDLDSLLAACEAVEAETDAAGLYLPQKRPWPTLDVWDVAVLAETDAARYDAVFREGEAGRHRDALRNALSFVESLQQYVPAEAAYADWQDGLHAFADGAAAFYCMGDWAAGVLDGFEGATFGEDWGSVPFPGTEGVYQVVMDALFTPTTNANPDEAEAVLRAFGSADALERFTRERGAVPPREDCSVRGHSPFFQRQMEYFERSTDQVDAMRGTGTLPYQRVELLAQIATFLAEAGRDVETTTAAIVDALDE